MGAGAGLRAIGVSLCLVAATGAAGADLSPVKTRLLASGLLSNDRPAGALPDGRPALDAYVSLPNPGPAPLSQPPRAEDAAGLGLFQRLALFFSGSPREDAVAFAPMDPVAATALPVEDVPYSGPIPAGTIVINMSQLHVFRIREGGWAERYRAETRDQLLSMITRLR